MHIQEEDNLWPKIPPFTLQGMGWDMTLDLNSIAKCDYNVQKQSNNINIEHSQFISGYSDER